MIVIVGRTVNFFTDFYIKPANTRQFLLAFSCHPSQTKRNIAYSQAFPISRICSSQALTKLRCEDLEVYLVRRGDTKKVRSGINEALNAVPIS